MFFLNEMEKSVNLGHREVTSGMVVKYQQKFN